jgi:hypothetical protein
MLTPRAPILRMLRSLDLGFDPNKPDYSNRLIGLLLAARDINISARSMGKKALVAIFLREDIYDQLHFEDKNKITENFSSTIEWDAPPRAEKTLRVLMEKRFEAVLGQNGQEEVAWHSVFDETKQMPGASDKVQSYFRSYLQTPPGHHPVLQRSAEAVQASRFRYRPLRKLDENRSESRQLQTGELSSQQLLIHSVFRRVGGLKPAAARRSKSAVFIRLVPHDYDLHMLSGGDFVHNLRRKRNLTTRRNGAFKFHGFHALLAASIMAHHFCRIGRFASFRLAQFLPRLDTVLPGS